MGPLDGQATGQEGQRILALGAAENIDAGHLGVLGRRRSQGQVEDGPEMVLELGGRPPPQWSSGPSCGAGPRSR